MKERGFVLLAENFRCRQGEVDLVGQEEDCLVFVEVKYRSREKSGSPEEAVGSLKQQRICRTSDYFRLQNPRLSRLQVRYDVVAVTDTQVRWYKNAFPYQNKRAELSW